MWLLLENVTYTYLRSHVYDASVGTVGKLELDFISRRPGDSYAYVQVSMSVVDPGVEEREYRPFRSVRDSWPCYLLTLDPLPEEKDGVRHTQPHGDDGAVRRFGVSRVGAILRYLCHRCGLEARVRGIEIPPRFSVPGTWREHYSKSFEKLVRGTGLDDALSSLDAAERIAARMLDPVLSGDAHGCSWDWRQLDWVEVHP